MTSKVRARGTKITAEMRPAVTAIAEATARMRAGSAVRPAARLAVNRAVRPNHLNARRRYRLRPRWLPHCAPVPALSPG